MYINFPSTYTILRLQLPFQVGTYDDTISGHSTPCPVDPDLLTSEPLLSMLRVYYHVSLTGSVDRLIVVYESGGRELLSAADCDGKLAIPSHDIKSLKCLQMKLPVDDIATLPSHQDVVKNMHLASVMILCKPLIQSRGSCGTERIKRVEK